MPTALITTLTEIMHRIGFIGVPSSLLAYTIIRVPPSLLAYNILLPFVIMPSVPVLWIHGVHELLVM